MSDDSASPNPSGVSAYKPEYAEQARKLAALGAIDREIGEFFGVTDRTLRNWRHRHAEFDAAMKIGKEAADDRVERSLYQRAVGYSFEAEKIMQDKGSVVRADYVEHLPPDVSAAQYWLNNRKGYDWKSKVEHEHSGKIGLEQLVAGQGQEPDPETP